MKILTVTVMPNSSIDRLAEPVKEYNKHLSIEIFPFHGKRYSEEDVKLFEEKAKGVDLIDFEYWRGADVLLKKISWLKDKKKILVHHNPYDLDKIDPKLFDKVVVKNETQQGELPDSILIRHGVDIKFFEFNNDYPDREKKTVGMVAFRIEKKKGIREIAEVCKELGYRFLLVGHVTKPEYFSEIMKIGCDFREDISNEELREAYKEMDVLVCNSGDNFESGPMPVLEAMSMGVPVMTREVGLVPDLDNGENMVIRRGEREDKEGIKEKLQKMMGDYKERIAIRNNAWDSLKNYSDYRMAKEYAKLYNEVVFPVRPLVSVITPVYNRVAQVLEIIDGLEKQTYKNIELVICDDNSTDGLEAEINQMREKVSFPIKYVNTKKDGYNLAMARNLGVIEADGDYLMFLDSRFLPESNVIELFMGQIGKGGKLWLFGDKGPGKRSFVENFSFIKRKLLIQAGMFNERIEKYGGMSQELRGRFQSQGFKLWFMPEVKAKEILSAKKKSEKRMELIESKNLLWKLGL